MIKLREMVIEDYENIITLWRNSEGVQLRDADSKQGIKRYLERNPGLNYVAINGGEVIGTIMAGHDGKRGYIQHLSVSISHRNNGIATLLVKKCLESLKAIGIIKSHVHVLSANSSAKEFWLKQNWIKRDDIETYSYINSENKNA